MQFVEQSVVNHRTWPSFTPKVGEKRERKNKNTEGHLVRPYPIIRRSSLLKSLHQYGSDAFLSYASEVSPLEVVQRKPFQIRSRDASTLSFTRHYYRSEIAFKSGGERGFEHSSSPKTTRLPRRGSTEKKTELSSQLTVACTGYFKTTRTTTAILENCQSHRSCVEIGVSVPSPCKSGDECQEKNKKLCEQSN